MMSLTIRNSVLALVFAAAGTGLSAEKGIDAVDGPNVRVMRQDDGSKTVFERSPDNKTLTTRNLSPRGDVQLRTIYRMDANTNPISCKIFDGLGTELFKVSYGYRKSDGQLVAEQMFDSRVKRLDPQNPSKEMPVRYLVYTYDSNGKRSAPISYTSVKGGTADDIFGSKLKIAPFKPEDNPFKGAQPAAKPAGRR
ncbi:hypothetical protein KBB96_18905 [Luteolibacter ambystomatis]|uniref:Uncharacterized protein n=1 Tax=Luteolibacter ambystomatis TaxID=2824561 RepID=A0A975G8W1_9BACT|nr:hypothetical protein [Luteolibacter ambystomatis]QUE50916.1 hypothetical protein KBB96_18905 [Luteolibacter ambystomatis]